MADVESQGGHVEEGSSKSISKKASGPCVPRSSDAIPTQPRRTGRILGLIRGFLQRLRGWGRGLLSYGPFIPGDRLFLFQRARQGALYGAGIKITISAKSSWRNVVKQPLHCVVGFLRPVHWTLALMVAGAGVNIAYYLLQMRYYHTDLSVVPPENRWHQLLRVLFGARPPARKQTPSQPPALPSIHEDRPSREGARPAPPKGQTQGLTEASLGQTPAAQAAAHPEATPAPGSLFSGSPSSSFVELGTSSPPRTAPEADVGTGQEGPWSDVPLGAGTQTTSTPEDWTEVERSGSGSPSGGTAGGQAGFEHV